MRLSEIARVRTDDYGKEGTLTTTPEPATTRALPGGSGYTYAVGGDAANKEIMLFDQGRLVGELDLADAGAPVPMWKVQGIAAIPEYQGRGIGMILYGIALSIMKLTLQAGESQTTGGQRMWLKLNSIPGVEVQGMATTPRAQYRARPNEQVLWQDHDSVTHTFPVGAGARSMRSASSGRAIYNNRGGMIARWTGQ
jgi:GNAT superfamily N-acetyltransferase